MVLIAFQTEKRAKILADLEKNVQLFSGERLPRLLGQSRQLIREGLLQSGQIFEQVGCLLGRHVSQQ
jgi:hypothetical protein